MSTNNKVQYPSKNQVQYVDVFLQKYYIC